MTINPIRQEISYQRFKFTLESTTGGDGERTSDKKIEWQGATACERDVAQQLALAAEVFGDGTRSGHHALMRILAIAIVHATPNMRSNDFRLPADQDRLRSLDTAARNYLGIHG